MSILQRVLWRDLWHLRGQVLAAALVVACGIVTLVATRATWQSLVEARDDFYTTHRFADVFARCKRAPLSLADEISRLPGVGRVQPRVVVEMSADIPGLREPALLRAVSIPGRPEPMLNDLHLVRGRYVDPGVEDEVIVSEAFARANRLEVGGRFSALLHGRWTSLSIVGIALSPEFVYEVGPGVLLPDNRRYGVIWMDRDVLAPAFDMQGAFNDVAVVLAAGGQERAVVAALDTLLRPYGGLSAHGRDDQLSHQFLRDELEELGVLTATVPLLFLAVSAFLLYVVLSRLVAAQRTQIGLLKAFGHTDLRVAAHYLRFALATVGVGLAVGLPLGLAVAGPFVDMYRDYFRFPRLALMVDPQLLALAASVTLAAGCLGALIAVRRAARLAPAEAMRPEAPAPFHAGLLERGIRAPLLPASLRMILRNLARRPWKAALSTLGMAFGIGLMVVGRFSLDSAGYMLQVHFDVLQRQDLTVFYSEPRGPQAAFDLAADAAVLRVEPFRTVPVWLRFEHRARRVGIVGLSPEPQMRRLLDERLREVRLPPEGLVLVDKLARLLGVVPGDTVTMEVLEGARAVRSVPVVAVVDEMLGLGAYMDAAALARLLGEDHSSSGAYLQIHPDAAEAFYARLKRLPVVAGVAVRGAMQQSLRELLDRNFVFFSAVFVLFSCVIIAGMVYNSARIALSERGNELASLSVLGFTRREVGVLLLGEQALLLLMAIPLGLGLGVAMCAALVPMFDRELFRLPLVIGKWSLVYPVIAALVAGALSGLLVARRIRHLDLIAVLKTRE